MLQQLLQAGCLLVLIIIGWFANFAPAQAAKVDPYILRYLRITEPIALNWDSQGQTRLFSPQDLSQGKHLFEENCKTCHVGGATLPNPMVSLALADLQKATPPRDAVTSLVAYMRQPMTYDGSEPMDLCRTVSESWLSSPAVDNLAAFILAAAQKAPGWGTKTFE